MLSVEKVSIQFLGRVLYKDLSFTVSSKDRVCFAGPNGAGKSTTIGIVCSLVKKTSGTVTVFDFDIDQDFALAKKNISMIF